MSLRIKTEDGDIVVADVGGGGSGGDNYLKNMLLPTWYDAEIPYYISGSQIVMLDGEVHVLGGNSDDALRQHYKYNGEDWISVSTLPYDFYNGFAVIINNEIHILGSSKTSHEKKHYKFSNGMWKSVSTLPYVLNAYSNSLTVLEDTIYVRWSSDGNGVQSYFFAFSISEGEWVRLPSAPYLASRTTLIAFKNEIHLMGGISGSSYYTYHYKYNPQTKQFVSVSTLPYGFSSTSAVVLNDKIYAFGGGSSSSSKKRAAQFDNKQWSSLADLPFEVSGNPIILLDENIIIASNPTSHFKVKPVIQ